MKLKPKDTRALRQLGRMMAGGGAAWSDFDEAKAQALMDRTTLRDGLLTVDRQVARDLEPAGIEGLDLSGGLRVTYSATVISPGEIQRQLCVSRKGGRRVPERLVRDILGAVGFGDGDPSRNPASGVWHTIAMGAPPGPASTDAD